MRNSLACYFRHGDTLRSRSVGRVVLSGAVDIPPPPGALVADWAAEASSHLGLEPGDVQPLPLARARVRWKGYRHCVQAASDWTHTLGMPGVLDSSAIALMACRGARYHHDGEQYGGFAFCNLFVSEDKGQDLHFPGSGHRIPLIPGTIVMFDTGQPHAVIARRSGGFDIADFPPGQDNTQVFLTWEVSLAHPCVGRALQIDFDIEPSTTVPNDKTQVCLHGTPARVCPASGRWCQAA